MIVFLVYYFVKDILIILISGYIGLGNIVMRKTKCSDSLMGIDLIPTAHDVNANNTALAVREGRNYFI